GGPSARPRSPRPAARPPAGPRPPCCRWSPGSPGWDRDAGIAAPAISDRPAVPVAPAGGEPGAAPPRRGRRRSRPRGGPLARRLFLIQLVLIVAVCIALSVTSYVTTMNNIREATADRVLSIAETLAHDPFVTAAVAEDDPSAKLQPFAQTVISTAEVDFVTI